MMKISISCERNKKFFFDGRRRKLFQFLFCLLHVFKFFFYDLSLPSLMCEWVFSLKINYKVRQGSTKGLVWRSFLFDTLRGFFAKHPSNINKWSQQKKSTLQGEKEALSTKGERENKTLSAFLLPICVLLFLRNKKSSS